jgi:hypothetical protein
MRSKEDYNTRKKNILQSPEVGGLAKIAVVGNMPTGADATRR